MAKKGKKKILKIVAISILTIIALLVGGLTFVTLWLTPSRLSDIASSRASEYLYADVKFHNLRFTFWSSFPRFVLEADSISVESHTLDSIPESQKKSLPEGYSHLFSTSGFKGSLNVPALAKGKIKLHDVSIKGLSANLVSISDSVANWLIFPPQPEKHPKIPEISADRIGIEDSRGISYTAVATGLYVRMNPFHARMEHLKHKGTYRCETGGDLTLAYNGLNLLSRFPFRLDGDVAVKFNPFKTSFSDLGIGLGNVKGRVSLDMEASDNLRFNDFSFSLDTFRLLGLLDYLPKELIPQIPDQESGIPIGLTARLTAPFVVSSQSLPSLEITATMPGGPLAFPIESGRDVSFAHSDITARLDFDGNDPDASRISISPISITGGGVDAEIKTQIENPGGRPKVKTDVELYAAFNDRQGGLSDLLPILKALKAKGEASVKLDLSLRLPSITRLQPEDVDLNAEINVPNFGILTETDGHSDLKVADLNLRLVAKGVLTNGVPTLSSPMDYDLRIGGASWRSGSTRLQTAGLTASGKSAMFSPTAIFDSLATDLRASSFRMTTPGHSLDIAAIKVDGHLGRRSPAERETRKPSAAPASEDSLWLSKTPHSPVYLAMHNKGMETFVRNWLLAADTKIGSAEWKSDSYPHPFRMKDADLWCDFDSVSVRGLDLFSGESNLALKGYATGLRPFFMSDPAAPLKAKFDIDTGTIDINQIAKATSHPSTATRSADSLQAHHAATAWLMPRNLDADLSLKGRSILYTNLDLQDLDGRIRLRDGVLLIPSLNLATSFAKLGIAVDFNTADIADMTMQASLRLSDIDLEPLYGKFKSLTSELPQIRNLSGHAAIGGTVRFDISPDMSVDMASLSAALSVEGRGLVLKQDKFIRRITRMMLIPDGRPISISDLDVRVGVRDNLLQLFPFELDFDRYRLTAEGVNNFAGALDYHLGINHSPIPFPFGINIGGDYHHPKVRFGGAGWRPDGARRVTSRIEKSFSWNFSEKMKWAGNVLLKKAASGETL